MICLLFTLNYLSSTIFLEPNVVTNIISDATVDSLTVFWDEPASSGYSMFVVYNGDGKEIKIDLIV